MSKDNFSTRNNSMRISRVPIAFDSGKKVNLDHFLNISKLNLKTNTHTKKRKFGNIEIKTKSISLFHNNLSDIILR